MIPHRPHKIQRGHQAKLVALLLLASLLGFVYSEASAKTLDGTRDGVSEQGPCTSELAIATFDDRDSDGHRDPSESYLPWSYTLTVHGVDRVVQSPAGGWYRTSLTAGDTWMVLASASNDWAPTTPSSISDMAACADQEALFGVHWKPHVYLPLIARKG